jgi:hypothetical protein
LPQPESAHCAESSSARAHTQAKSLFRGCAIHVIVLIHRSEEYLMETLRADICNSFGYSGFYVRGNSLISPWPGVITSIWWLYSLKNILLFSVVLYICSLSLYFSKPFSTMIVRYSFSCAYGRNALYIILAWVAPRPSPPPSFAASSICATMSVRLLYLIAKYSKNDLNERYGGIFCKQKPIIESFMQYYCKSLSFKACWLIVLQVISSPPSISGRAWCQK